MGGPEWCVNFLRVLGEPGPVGDSSRSAGPAAVWSDRLIPWFCDSDPPLPPSQVDRFAHDKKEPMSAFFRRHCSFANMSMYGGAVWARCTMRCDWEDRCKGVYILLRRCCLTRKLHFIGCRQQCSSKTKLIPSAMSRESQTQKAQGDHLYCVRVADFILIHTNPNR